LALLRFVETLPSAGQQFFDDRRQRAALFLHGCRESFHADRVHQLKRTKFPGKAPAHRAIDIRNLIRNFRHASRRIETIFGQQAPQKLLGLVALLAFENRADQRAQAFGRVFDRLCAFNGREARLLPGAILHGVHIEREDFFFAFALYLFVEALSGLITEPAASRHFFEQRGNAIHLARFVVGHGIVNILHDVQQHIEADEIGGAKGRRFRLADRRAGAGVDFFDGHAERAHEVQRVEHGKCADAVGDEVRRIFRDHYAFAQATVAEFREGLDDFRRGLRPGNQLDQFHIARRVEKVRAGPVLLKLFAHASGNQMNRQSGSIGGDDGAGLAKLRDACQKVSLDFEIFGDDFDDPIGFRAARQVIVEISDGHAIGQGSGEKRRRLGFFRGVETRANDFVARVGRRVLRKSRWNDIEQDARQPGVCKVRRDPRAHGSCAQHDCFFNSTLHREPRGNMAR
jgi:hypothetical protein